MGADPMFRYDIFTPSWEVGARLIVAVTRLPVIACGNCIRYVGAQSLGVEEARHRGHEHRSDSLHSGQGRREYHSVSEMSTRALYKVRMRSRKTQHGMVPLQDTRLRTSLKLFWLEK
jgi:hypothetical protein